MITYRHTCIRAPRARIRCAPHSTRKGISALALERPVQSYISTSRDPYLNLSIEHHLLQKSAADSAILFLYVNRPSVIIGRNQNPWLEVNLALLKAGEHAREDQISGVGLVDLVRRRSGGGTVFHDEGNVNWTVISPSSAFTRDKHAEMVVRALRSCGVDRARVNERHDIVLDQGHRKSHTDPDDTHDTPYRSSEPTAQKPLKISGSAYKLTRQRALHHGTCLLSSPNLHIIPHYLHSPAKHFIKARGVESVSSPVGNVLVSNQRFIEATTTQFHAMYSSNEPIEAMQLGNEALDTEAIRKGFDELKSLEWTFLQTPQFELGSHFAPGNVAAQQLTHTELPRVDMTARSGAITDACITIEGNRKISTQHMVERRLHEINDWEAELNPKSTEKPIEHSRKVAAWLQRMLPSV